MGATFLDLFAAKIALELGILTPEQARAALAEADRSGVPLLRHLEQTGMGGEKLRLIDQGGRRCLFLKGEDSYRRLLTQAVPSISMEQLQAAARSSHPAQRRLGLALVEERLLEEARDRELVAQAQESIAREGEETVRALRERAFEGIEAPSRMIAAVAAGLARSSDVARTARRQRKLSGRRAAAGAAVAEGTPQEPLPAPPPPLPSLRPPPTALPLPGVGALETIGQSEEVTAQMDTLPPELKGSGLEEKYVIPRKLGEGGMGAVYLAFAKEDRGHQKPMALKVVRPGVGTDRSKEAAARFKREILATSFCAHENIIEIYDANETADGSYYMAMEYLDGEQLDEVLKREGKLPIPRLVDLLEQVLLGMVAYHSANIVHRDIKPQNFRVWRDPAGRERLKIMDFGIARVLDAADSGMEEQFYKTISGKITGSPAYLSPESITDPDHVDQRADLYSLGITIYRLAANRLPFVAREASEFLPLHLYSRPPSLKEIAPETPPALEALYYKLLEKLPTQRLASAAEALEILRRDVKPALGMGAAPEPAPEPASAAPPGDPSTEATQAPAADAAAPAAPEAPKPAPPAPRPPAPAPAGRGRMVLLLVVIVLLLAGVSGAYWAHTTGRLVIPGIPR